MRTGLAAACYVPIPLVAWLCARAAPHDRLVRYHARQGGWTVAAGWALLVLVGLWVTAAPGPAPTTLAAILLAVTLLACLVGAVSAGRGRFVRLRPVWDALAT